MVTVATSGPAEILFHRLRLHHKSRNNCGECMEISVSHRLYFQDA